MRAALIILLSFLGIGALDITAQQSNNNPLFARFETRFKQLDAMISSTSALPAAASGRATQVIAAGADNPVVDSLIDRKVAAEISAMKNVTGITVNGQIYGRLDEGFGLDEDDALSRYKTKIQAEIRWNFLKSSLINRKGKANEIRLKGEIERMKYRREDIGNLVAKQQEQFHQQYDSLLYSVLSHRIENLQLLSDAQTYLLVQGGISSDDLLNILNDKAEAERLMATITKSYTPAEDLSNPGGIIVDIDTLRLMNFIIDHSASTSTIELQRQLLTQQIANTTYWNTLNVSPFIRYSYYMRPNIPNSSNIDAGISFIVPLTLETAKKRKAMRAERDVLELEKDRVTALITEKVRLDLLDIERMNRSIAGEVSRLRELKGYLQMRRNAYDKRIGEYNYLLRMKEYNTYLLCCERLLSFTYRRDCLVASLQNYLPEVSILDFCTETQLEAKSVTPLQ